MNKVFEKSKVDFDFVLLINLYYFIVYNFWGLIFLEEGVYDGVFYYFLQVIL